MTIPSDKLPSASVLLVDDDPDMLELLSTWLGNAGYKTVGATSGQAALAQVALARPDLVVTDLVMDDMDGMALLTNIHASNPLLPVIMLSGQAQIPDAVRATHLGTSAFLTKPIDKGEFLREISAQLRFSQRPDTQDNAFREQLIYRSAVMTELLEQAELVARGDVTVFISGETGTGKEVIARAIHAASPRAAQPFIAVNCGAIPEQLLESELFGHEKGAFTGAATQRDGLFKAANDGTLFLDEIGDMPLGLQVKLLRVLQDFEIRPVGATQSVAVNVRIISATHNDLESRVRDGAFREDLYYRLNVVPLHMPSLDERREDIPLLLDHFLQRYAERMQARPKRFDVKAFELLQSAQWPGNIRQLMNAVELCATLTKGAVISETMARKALRGEPERMQTLKEAKHDFERNYLVSVLRLANGNVAGAARMAGRNRTEFYKLLNAHGLEPGDFRLQ